MTGVLGNYFVKNPGLGHYRVILKGVLSDKRHIFEVGDDSRWKLWRGPDDGNGTHHETFPVSMVESDLLVVLASE